MHSITEFFYHFFGACGGHMFTHPTIYATIILIAIIAMANQWKKSGRTVKSKNYQ